MKAKVLKAIKDLSREDLLERLIEKRKEQLKYKVQKSQGQLNQTHFLRQVRREIAQIKTVLNNGG